MNIKPGFESKPAALTTDEIPLIFPQKIPVPACEEGLNPLRTRVKANSMDNIEFEDFLGDRFIFRVERERRKALLELLPFLRDRGEFSEEIRSVWADLESSNTYELISLKTREALKRVEELIKKISIKMLKFVDFSKETLWENASPTSLVESPQGLPKKSSGKQYSPPCLLPQRKTLANSLRRIKALRFILAKMGHLVHWKGFIKLGDEKKPRRPKIYDKIEDIRSRKYIEDRAFYEKQNLVSLDKGHPIVKPLLKYFERKTLKWFKERCERTSISPDPCKHPLQMICKICLSPIEIKSMAGHSELCMKKSQLGSELQSLKSYFHRFFVNASRNARYYEKLLGIESRKGLVSEDFSRSLSNSGKRHRKSLKLKVFEEDEMDSAGMLRKMQVFIADSDKGEKPKEIKKKMRLLDVIAKSSSFFLHEEINKSKFVDKSLIFTLDLETLHKLREVQSFLERVRASPESRTAEIENFEEFLALIRQYLSKGSQYESTSRELGAFEVELPLPVKEHYDSDPSSNSNLKRLKTPKALLSDLKGGPRRKPERKRFSIVLKRADLGEKCHSARLIKKKSRILGKKRTILENEKNALKISLGRKTRSFEGKKEQTRMIPKEATMEAISPGNVTADLGPSQLNVRKKMNINRRKTVFKNQALLKPIPKKPLEDPFSKELAELIDQEEDFLVSNVLPSENGYFSDSVQNPAKTYHQSQINVSVNDFEYLRLINKGAYGRVWLVRRKFTNDLYAMKIVDLAEHLHNKKDIKTLRAESEIYDVLSSDFVVNALFKFTHETFLCFVTEYMIGGDFAFLLHQYGPLEESFAQFYLAELVLAIDHLHSLHIIHRDLKPDNMLLDHSGHMKLTDFGLSELGFSSQIRSPKLYSPKSPELNLRLKVPVTFVANPSSAGKKPKNRGFFEGSLVSLEEDLAENHKLMNKETGSFNKLLSPRKQQVGSSGLKRNRILGTPDYIAPEVLDGQGGNSFAIDWWALGVLAFEFLVGIPPFNGETVPEIFENIKGLRIPWESLTIGYGENEMSPEAKDLIVQLLRLDPGERITKKGSEALRAHPFFAGIVWDRIRESPAPIVPQRRQDESVTVRTFNEEEKIDPFFKGSERSLNQKESAKINFMIQSNFSHNTIRFDLLKRENIKEMAEFRALNKPPPKVNEYTEKSCVFEEGNFADSSSDLSHNKI